MNVNKLRYDLCISEKKALICHFAITRAPLMFFYSCENLIYDCFNDPQRIQNSDHHYSALAKPRRRVRNILHLLIGKQP